MQHRGVEYEVKVAAGSKEWVWITHTNPKPKRGSTSVSRDFAVILAKDAIERWYRKNPAICAAQN